MHSSRPAAGAFENELPAGDCTPSEEVRQQPARPLVGLVHTAPDAAARAPACAASASAGLRKIGGAGTCRG